jgi:hypothetical protein
MHLYQTASYENRRGTLFPENGKVEFCGVIFADACDAISVLRYITGECIVGPFHYAGVKGFELNSGKIIGLSPQKIILEYNSQLTARASIHALKKKGLL